MGLVGGGCPGVGVFENEFCGFEEAQGVADFFYFVALPEVGVDYEFVDAGVLMDVVVYVAADGGVGLVEKVGTGNAVYFLFRHPIEYFGVADP